MSSQLNIFQLKRVPSFKLIIFNVVSVCLCLAHSVRCNFRNTMPIHEPVGVIRQPFSSGNGGEGGIEFVCCVEGREMQVHKLWSFTKDRITFEVRCWLLIQRLLPDLLHD